MKFSAKWIVVGLLLSTGFVRAEDTSYEAEKAKALKNPYANDFGPKSIDVSAYPPEMQDAYKNILLVKCQRCHEASRPLNSQFVEPSAPKEQHLTSHYGHGTTCNHSPWHGTTQVGPHNLISRS